MKIFKEYLKTNDRYFPPGEIQALNLIQNLLEDGFSFQGLKYVKKIVEDYEVSKEYDIIKNIGDKYLNKKIIQALTSEIFFDKAYTLTNVLRKSKLCFLFKFYEYQRKSTNGNQISNIKCFELYWEIFF